MNRTTYIILAAIALVIASAVYLCNKPHQNMQHAKADLSLSSEALSQAFDEDELAANSKFLGKILLVSGTVRETTTLPDGTVKVTFDGGDFGVTCELDPNSKHERNAFQVGEKVRFKGQCDGYNLSVLLSRCVESK
jgi:hypothetical protein